MLLVHGRNSVDLGPLDDDVADLAVDLDLTTAEAGERSLDAVVDGAACSADRAAQFLSWRLTARNTRAWLDATRYHLRAALAEYGLAVPPVGPRDARDRRAPGARCPGREVNHGSGRSFRR